MFMFRWNSTLHWATFRLLLLPINQKLVVLFQLSLAANQFWSLTQFHQSNGIRCDRGCTGTKNISPGILTDWLAGWLARTHARMCTSTCMHLRKLTAPSEKSLFDITSTVRVKWRKIISTSSLMMPGHCILLCMPDVQSHPACDSTMEDWAAVTNSAYLPASFQTWKFQTTSNLERNKQTKNNPYSKLLFLLLLICCM